MTKNKEVLLCRFAVALLHLQIRCNFRCNLDKPSNQAEKKPIIYISYTFTPKNILYREVAHDQEKRETIHIRFIFFKRCNLPEKARNPHGNRAFRGYTYLFKKGVTLHKDELWGQFCGGTILSWKIISSLPVGQPTRGLQYQPATEKYHSG